MTKKAKIFGSILLLIFIWHLCEISLFLHTHIVDGETITHSHLHSGTSENPKHGHSVGQLVIITQTVTAAVIAGAVCFSAILVTYHSALFVKMREISAQHTKIRYNDLRGPPVLS